MTSAVNVSVIRLPDPQTLPQWHAINCLGLTTTEIKISLFKVRVQMPIRLNQMTRGKMHCIFLLEING